MKRVAAFLHGKGQGQRDRVEAVNVTHALCDFSGAESSSHILYGLSTRTGMSGDIRN